MNQERINVTMMKGNPLILIGAEIKIGDKAPEFKVVNTDLAAKSLADFGNKVKLISVVPSLDTSVCDLQTRRFNEEAAKIGKDIIILTISMDLPFAQARWCGAAGVDRVITLSDYQEASFGKAFGVLIKGLRLLNRAIFVLDKQNIVRYVEYVKENTTLPDFESALSAAQKLN